MQETGRHLLDSIGKVRGVRCWSTSHLFGDLRHADALLVHLLRSEYAGCWVWDEAVGCALRHHVRGGVQGLEGGGVLGGAPAGAVLPPARSDSLFVLCVSDLLGFLEWRFQLLAEQTFRNRSSQAKHPKSTEKMSRGREEV
jgi:hypothetical protein